ncbi:MAG: hypothetical protein HC912_02055 [Saprospiraceae bacterium]|nr:hypothetical protein [Saprospiraceae bacterium]
MTQGLKSYSVLLQSNLVLKKNVSSLLMKKNVTRKKRPTPKLNGEGVGRIKTYYEKTLNEDR